MDYYNPNLPLSGYSYDGEKRDTAVQERPTAAALRAAFEDLQTAQREFERVQNKVPGYTAQWSDADYTRDEEQTMIAASHAFEDALVASVLARTSK